MARQSNLVTGVAGLMITMLLMVIYLIENPIHIVSDVGFSPFGGTWITDDWEPGVLWSLKLGKKLLDVQSKFQHVTVHESPSLGRVLALDGILQASARDEKGYHEMIVHVPLSRKGASASQDKHALVIGGGDGGAVREILRHPDINKVTQVEIDPAVIQAAKDFLPSIWQHPYIDAGSAPAPLHVDPRLTVLNLDALQYLQERANQKLYDLIIVDASDPIGPGKSLYTTEFYELLKSVMRPGGAVAVQGGSFFWFKGVFNTVYHQLDKVFPVVKPYQCFTAIYPGGVWNLQLATLGDDPQEVDTAKVNAIKTRAGESLQWYSAATHQASFALPPIALKVLEDTPLTLEELEKTLL